MKEKKYYMWDNDEKEEAFAAVLGVMVKRDSIVLPMEWVANSLGTARGAHEGWKVVKRAFGYPEW